MPQSLRVIFMGTPDFAVPALHALNEVGHKIVAVYTQPPRPAGRGHKERKSPVHEYALLNHLPVLTPASLKLTDTQEKLREFKADVIVVAAYGLILPKAVLTAARMGCLNIHPSLLPRWRGAAPLQRQIMAGDTETGVCIMQMDAGLDTGDVLMREKLPMPQLVTTEILHDFLAEKGAVLLLKTLKGLQEKTIKATPQSSEGITYANKITKEESRIDWTRDAQALLCHINGLNPWPAASFVYNNETLKVFEAEIVAYDGNAKAGTLLDDQLTIACGQNALRLHKLQRPNKNSTIASEFLKGYPMPAGSVLE